MKKWNTIISDNAYVKVDERYYGNDDDVNIYLSPAVGKIQGMDEILCKTKPITNNRKWNKII